jgi:GT2 family glycosyltransferase
LTTLLTDANATPAIAVVVVARNAGGYLAEVAESLERLTLKPRRVIVVDNDSTDGSVDALAERHSDVDVLRPGRNIGFAAANNEAARAARECEWIALLNPDAFPEPGWLAALADAAREHPECAVIGSRLDRATAPGELDGSGDVYHVSGLAWRRDHRRPVREGSAAGEIFSACAAAAMYRRDAFLSAGGFDERFFCYFEDTDLAFRLRLQGHRCWYEPRSVVRHVGSGTAGVESDFTIYHSHRNLVWTYAKNMPSPLFWLYLPQHLLLNVLSVGWFSLRGQARPILAAKRDALRGLPHALRERRAIQARRKVRSSELRRLMSRGRGAYVTAASRAWASVRGQSGGSGETTAMPSRRAARPEAASSVAPRLESLGTPCVLPSERPSHPDDERRSTRPS